MIVNSHNTFQTDQLKIIDFGISRKFDNKSLKRAVGSTIYIAPEVLRNNYNEKCDIWSVGILAY
jgi:calcium-dependent protein kinase